MDRNVLISVIVPVYNVEAYLPRCVESILAQTYEKLEIILVDDGTKDASDRICDEYATRDSRIRVVHKENGGLSSARNAGLDIARGEFIAFVDSDDWIEPDSYRQMLALALEQNVKMVFAGRYDVSSDGKKKKGLCPPRREVVDAEEVIRRMFTWDHVDSASWDKLYHRSLFRQIRFPLGKVCEDVPIMYRIVLDAGRVAMLDQPIYNYFHRPGSITYSALSEKTFHFSQHTEVIYPYIQANHPALVREARYLRVRSLVYNVQSLDLASEEDRRRFRQVDAESRSELRRHLPFILTSPLFKAKERRTDLLLALNLYRSLRRLRHR